MKPFKNVAAVLLAAVMIVLSAGCTPISLSKEWSYRYGDDELSIGVYIYSLYQAYSQAQSYAESNENYSTDKSFMDLEITDDDGNTAVAKDWILNEADKITKSLLALDNELARLNVKLEQATIDEAKSTAQSTWDTGIYAAYGYFDPMSEKLEPYGISFDSFYVSSYEAMAKQSCLFNALYAKGGEKEVSDAELTDYFTENYTDYSFFPVNLYTTDTDDEGNSVNTALSDDEKAKVEDELNGYVKDIVSGKTFDDVLSAYMDANSITDDPSQKGIEILEDSTIGDDIKDKLADMKEGTAETLQVGDGDTAQLYFVYKGSIKNDVDDYINDATNRASVLSSMKSDEFNEYLDKLTEELEPEINTAQVNKYDPDMFFEPVEPTTTATEAETSAEE